jgi:hypothetical protein
MRLARYGALIGGFLVSMGIIMSAKAALAGDVIAWMDINPVGGLIQIAGRAYSAQQTTIDYTLQIQRIGGSGNTTTTQGGKADLHEDKAAVLSTTSVNMQPQDQLAILLTVSRGGEVLATSAIQVGSGPSRTANRTSD